MESTPKKVLNNVPLVFDTTQIYQEITIQNDC